MKKNVYITLLTDFGNKDWYASIVKGILYQNIEHLTIIDISHTVSPHQIREAAFMLSASYTSFPQGTIHLCLVEPAIGSSQQGLIVTTDQYIFVAPDNGILSMVINKEPYRRIYRINPAASLASNLCCRTYDTYTPLAALLAKGTAPGKLGIPTNTYIQSSFSLIPQKKGSHYIGEILYIDIFGNAMTNIPNAWFKKIISLTIKKKKITQGVLCYKDIPTGKNAYLPGNTGYIELACKESAFATKQNLSTGEQFLCHLRTNTT